MRRRDVWREGARKHRSHAALVLEPEEGSMDAIDVTKQDHRRVEELFKRYKQTGPRALKARQRLAERITKELSVHASIEEQLLYPALKRAGDGDVQEALHEHDEVKNALDRLGEMTPDDPEFDRTMKQVIQHVTHHAKEEEREMLPKLRKAMSKKDREDLGKRMQTAKKMAPTRPHPNAPKTPPVNLVAGPVAAVVDRVRDAVAGDVAGDN
jgi:hemerythrin superfamily protein